MKAIGVMTFGGPEVLHVVELPEPHAGAGEVRIRAHAASDNPALPQLTSASVFASEMASCCFKRGGKDRPGPADSSHTSLRGMEVEMVEKAEVS
jgi:hypothetical protein